MPSLTAESHLAVNLACLGERNADLAAKLAAVEPYPDILFAATPQGVPSATLHGKQLCSRHHPLDEARLQVDEIDLVEHAAVVVFGFGLGYHVQRLAERAAKATLIIVFETDLRLLRSVLEQSDHSHWMKDALILFITDPSDRGMLARKLDGAESILAQGVHFFEHPASRHRLRTDVSAFTTLFTEFIAAAKTTLMTTLMRSVDTTRNLMLNLDHYAAGAGVADLCNLAAGRPAVIVSAGPSLHKNMHLLKEPEIRERCVIIAVQTTLKPLLAAGIKPHFVTALDYHEISKRFYEDLNRDDLIDVTLVADPKVHPVVLDVFPGRKRCCANSYLDKLLGPLNREMGDLPAGATVAHLAVYLAKYLGCNPIALIGQDLGFSDGLYYAPARGASIHDVWAPELNPFNTIEMMEWQRIVRHRLHLKKVKDVHGKSIFTDAQMLTYLQQFERDFAQYKNEGLTIIDATEGGVAKQHTIAMPLSDFLARHVWEGRPLPPFPPAADSLDDKRLRSLQKRLRSVRAEAVRLKSLSHETARLLREMIDDQNNVARMSRHFEAVERNRKEVDKRIETFELLNSLNQVGVFNRMKADRRMHMQHNLNPLEKQRAQLERDLANVTWIADAAGEMLGQLEASDHLLLGRDKLNADSHAVESLLSKRRPASTAAAPNRIAALVPVDPHRNGLGISRSLAEPFNGRPVIQATLERLGQSAQIESIILMAPEGLDVDSLLNRASIDLPVEIERVNGSPFGPENRAIAAARLWADTCWRGGIAGTSIYDEALCPPIMHEIMQRRGLTAALIAAPDWPLIQVRESGGCDDVIARHLEHPQQHHVVFTQSPPGLCGCLVSATLMQELSQRNRLSTVGGLLVYQPHAPQGDPIARDATVQIDHTVRHSLIRATFDSSRQRDRLRHIGADHAAGAPSLIKLLEASAGETPAPQHITLELCTQRTSRGLFRTHSFGQIHRAPMSLELANRVFHELQKFNVDDLVLTLGGAGDPLLHPQFDDIIRLAGQTGIRGVHVRTELLTDRTVLDRLLKSGVDVVSVDLNADRAITYQTMMGLDRFKDVLLNIEYLLEYREKLTAHAGNAAFALPWVVPHLQRCAATYEDIESFFDRWQHTLGCAVIEGAPPPPFFQDAELPPALTPSQAIERDRRRRLTVFCDGSVPVDEWDWPCHQQAGHVMKTNLVEIWRARLKLISAHA